MTVGSIFGFNLPSEILLRKNDKIEKTFCNFHRYFDIRVPESSMNASKFTQKAWDASLVVNVSVERLVSVAASTQTSLRLHHLTLERFSKLFHVHRLAQG